MEQHIVAAIIAGVVSILTTLATIGVQRAAVRRQYRLEYMAEAAAEELLKQPPYRMRSFEMIKHHLAGFGDDDQLRQVLVRAGALRWLTKSNKEVWGLLRRNRRWLSVKNLPVELENPEPIGEEPPLIV
jgi:hypothetical protein